MASCSELIPPSFRQGAQIAADALQTLADPLIATHVRPDGDAIGALLACGFIEQGLGHNFALYAPDGIPEYLSFLERPGPVYRSLAEIPFAPQSAIFLDLSDPARLGPELAARYADWSSLNIDHHVCEQGLGSAANYISADAAAACQLVAYAADALGLTLAPPLGAAIATGILTDTGNYTHANISGPIFCLSAELENNGVRIADIGAQLRSGWSLNRMKLWGYLFMRAKQSQHGLIAWSLISEDDLTSYGCHAEDLEGYIDWLGRLRGVQIAFTLRETRERGSGGEQIVSRLSMRSKGDFNAREICLALGGGGHKYASGATIAGPPMQALPQVLQAIEHYLA